MVDCIFCRIIKGSIPSSPVYQDKDVLVIPDIHPQAPVHLLVIPKTHVTDVLEADEMLITKLMTVVKTIIVEKNITHYRLVHNGGDAALVKHLHIHILGSVTADRTL